MVHHEIKNLVNEQRTGFDLGQEKPFTGLSVHVVESLLVNINDCLFPKLPSKYVYSVNYDYVYMYNCRASVFYEVGRT